MWGPRHPRDPRHILPGQRFRRAARDAFDFDALLEFEENLVRRFALELEIIDDEQLPAAVGDVRDFGNAFVAPSSLVELLDLVVLERLSPAGSDAGFVGFDPAAARTDRDRKQEEPDEAGYSGLNVLRENLGYALDATLVRVLGPFVASSSAVCSNWSTVIAFTFGSSNSDL